MYQKFLNILRGVYKSQYTVLTDSIAYSVNKLDELAQKHFDARDSHLERAATHNNEAVLQDASGVRAATTAAKIKQAFGGNHAE